LTSNTFKKETVRVQIFGPSCTKKSSTQLPNSSIHLKIGRMEHTSYSIYAFTQGTV